jgi:hypothetical protein
VEDLVTITKYTYSIEADFPNHVVSTSALASEIAASAIVTSLNRVDTSGDSCDIWFNAALSLSDGSLLDAVVANHTGLLPSSTPQSVILSGPSTMDGKPIFLPNLFPGNVFLYYAGCGDDRTTGRGAGALFQLSSVAAEDKVLEAHFNDWVYLAGGALSWVGGVVGDYVTLEVVCPATAVTSVSGTGNCNVVNGVIVPAAGDGAYNVDLSAASPVPAQSVVVDESTPGTPNGYWNWSDSPTGLGTITPGTPGGSSWHLIAAEVKLVRFISKMPIFGTGTMTAQVPAVKPKKILPQWKFRVTLHNSTEKSLIFTWHFITARIGTV